MTNKTGMTCSALSNALKIADSTKDKVAEFEVVSDSASGAERYIATACTNGKVTLAKAPAAHN